MIKLFYWKTFPFRTEKKQKKKLPRSFNSLERYVKQKQKMSNNVLTTSMIFIKKQSYLITFQNQTDKFSSYALMILGFRSPMS